MTGGGYRLLASGQTLEGSFSALLTPIFRTKYSGFLNRFSRSTRFTRRGRECCRGAGAAAQDSPAAVDLSERGQLLGAEGDQDRRRASEAAAGHPPPVEVIPPKSLAQVDVVGLGRAGGQRD